MREKGKKKTGRKPYIFVSLVILCLCTALFACTKRSKEESQLVISASEADQEKIISISYDTPSCHPYIFINQTGLSLESNKYVLFSGNEKDTTFFVRDRETKEVVYEGMILPLVETEYAYGVFTELQMQGTYYIQTETLGESYPFVIGDEQLIEDIFERTLRSVIAQEDGTSIKAEDLQALFPILFAYELNPTIFLDASLYPLANQIPDVLDAMESIAEGIIEQGEIEEEGAAYFTKAAFFAQLAYVYQKYDVSIAQRMQQSAIEEYQKGQEWDAQNPTNKTYGEIGYLAAAQLYRTAGSWTYRNAAKVFCEEMQTSSLHKDILLYADMTHLSTRRSVDVAFCNARMETIQETIVKAIEEEEELLFFQKEMQIEEILLNCMRMEWMNGITSSNAYTDYVMKAYDYVLGVNIEGKSLDAEVAYEKADETFADNQKYNSLFLVLTSSIWEQEQTE